jgi:fermentation-respiration switch protein FrsA (DUF1100 family)
MKRKRLIAVVLAILLIIVLVPWFAGTLLTSPVQREVGNLPADLLARTPCFIGGSEDQHTTPQEMREMIDAAPEPKELWMVPKAKHVDLCQFAGAEYKDRILRFFDRHLATNQ